MPSTKIPPRYCYIMGSPMIETKCDKTVGPTGRQRTISLLVGLPPPLLMVKTEIQKLSMEESPLAAIVGWTHSS